MNNQSSLTALVSAFARSYHSQHATDKIFDDYLAHKLLTSEESSLIEKNFAQSISFFNPEQASICQNEEDALDWVMNTQCVPQTVSRARYAEDCLEQAIKFGVEQYVILGAGFDTFAFRRKDLLRNIHMFELDHPATQSLKKERMRQQGWDLPDKLHFIPIDFINEDLTTVLKHTPFDSNKRTFFNWLGVTYYLTKETFYQTFRSISKIAPARSMVVFDYLDDAAFIPNQASKRILQMQEMTKRAGEQLLTGFDPFTIDLELQQANLLLYENLSPENIEERYFTGREDHLHAFDHFHFAHAVIDK
ncbi:class I SAM-dependent methyltransferase [Ectobacillus polymachus]|uniref:class I SAM-dependent methyltransferase n=1 Tax=Ectobacillus polymachus TaxID=1508806 RepID=UPI003A893BF7